jgi:ATP-binding cassette subfamily A (ABC1) protein 3
VLLEISVFKQWWLLFCKRFRILRRRYLAYLFTICIAIVGAAVSPLLIKSFHKPMACPVQGDVVQDYTYRSDLGSNIDYTQWLFGPANAVDDEKLQQLTEVYSSKHYSDPEYSGYNSLAQLKGQLVLVDTYDQYAAYLKVNHTASAVYGGIWVGENPTIAYNSWNVNIGVRTQNFLNNYLSNVPISATYSSFVMTDIPVVYDLKALMFIIYYGLIMAVYPAFFVLYPTHERLTNVRSMQ